MSSAEMKALQKRRAALCSELRRLGVDARALERDEMLPEPFRVEEGQDAAGWIEIADGPIRWFILCAEHNHSHLCVPDPRLGSYPELGYAEVYPEVRRRFPLFGRVERVEWCVGGPYALEAADEFFYGFVADFLQNDTEVSETMMTTNWNVLEIFIDPAQRRWVICNPFPLPKWNCLQVIAKALLAMPMPTEE